MRPFTKTNRRPNEDFDRLREPFSVSRPLISEKINQTSALEDVQNSKLKTERELTNARMDFTSVTQELADALKENETLRNELKNLIKRGEQERTFFKRQTNEIIL